MSAIQSAVADVLRSMGHEVTIAHAAAEALALLSDAVSVVLSDVDLGGEVNGAKLALEVARRRPQVPCILMSGLPYDVLSSRFQLREPALLLAKPFSARQLEASHARPVATTQAFGTHAGLRRGRRDHRR